MDDEHDEALDMMPESTQSGRATSPSSSGLRQRPLGRATTFSESNQSQPFARRSSSFMSETLSDSKRSIQSTTNDILRPRASHDEEIHGESSNWHSLPLLLALLPAVGGLFFENGGAFITDVSLLGLAALFLNWTVRLPWDWYHSAQAVTAEVEDEVDSQNLDSAIDEENSEADSTQNAKNISASSRQDERAKTAAAELRVHEIVALAACFVCPLLGAWLLHAIRNQLSRPSEGLVSDYNLTIFLLASEVRPLSHLIKMIQHRTLFLQRTVSVTAAERTNKANTSAAEEPKAVAELTQRLAELEAHVAGSVLLPTSSSQPPSPAGDPSSSGLLSPKSTSPSSSSPPKSLDDIVTRASDQATTELRRTFQPDLDALNRAMRRYEKRLTVSAIQVETRLQDLEVKIQDVVILAAAVQRNADRQQGKYSPILLDWVSSTIVVPVQSVMWIFGLPIRIANMMAARVKTRLGFQTKINVKNGRSGKMNNIQGRTGKNREKKGKDSI